MEKEYPVIVLHAQTAYGPFETTMEAVAWAKKENCKVYTVHTLAPPELPEDDV